MNEDKATRYHRLRRQATFVGLVVKTVVLVGALLSGAAAALRDRLLDGTSSWVGPAMLYTTWVALALGVVDLVVEIGRAHV